MVSDASIQYRVYTGFNIFTGFYHIDLEEMVTLCKYTVPCRHRIVGYKFYNITDVNVGRLGFECIACDGILVVWSLVLLDHYVVLDHNVVVLWVHFWVFWVFHGVAHPEHLAGHFPLLTVATQVLLHVRLLLEPLSTDGAGEWTFPGVNSPVLSKVVPRCKLFSTHWTVQHWHLQQCNLQSYW